MHWELPGSPEYGTLSVVGVVVSAINMSLNSVSTTPQQHVLVEQRKQMVLYAAYMCGTTVDTVQQAGQQSSTGR